MMTTEKSPLHNLKIASPCPASWSEMRGDERSRFCGECKLNVYNLSDMTTAEAEELIRTREGRLCVRYFQRADGKVLTRDCPKGLMAVRMRLARAVALSAGLVLGVFGTAMAKVSEKPDQTWVDQAIEKGRTVPGVQIVVEKLCPSIQGDVMVGKIAPSPLPVAKGP
ncbi:MAG: hypothetical protein ACAH95_00925 [Fimbriimonas sp.]